MNSPNTFTTSWLADGALMVALGITHVLVGSIVFDLVHWLAHRSHSSPYYILRLLSKAHVTHHRFFNRKLQFNEAFRVRNLLSHLPLELFCQMVGTILSWILSQQFLSDVKKVNRSQEYLLFLILIIQAGRCCIVAWNDGRDSNHIPFQQLPKDPHLFVVGPQYHSLHHIDPHNYFGSMTRLVDWVLGTAVSLQGRRVAMTGSRGALGQAMLSELVQHRVKEVQSLRFGLEWTHGDYADLIPVLAKTDILILAHGTKDGDDVFQANCHSAVDIIQLFKETRLRSTTTPEVIPEVWYVGSEAEFHGAWSSGMRQYTASKRAFVPFARAYYDDESMVYRHIIPAAFKSNMGDGLATANWTAKTALWWIRRGARYVPVTYTGIAFLNFFRFLFWTKPCIYDDVDRQK